MVAGESGKDLYEALEVLLNFVEGGMAEAALDEVLNALIETGDIAKSYDGSGRSYALWNAARSFQGNYRRDEETRG